MIFRSTNIVTASLVIQNHLTQLIWYYVTKTSNRVTILMPASDCLVNIFSSFYCFVLMKEGWEKEEIGIHTCACTHTHTTHTPNTSK